MICLDKLPAENWCKARKRKYKRTHVPFHESSLYTKEQVGSAEIVPSAFAAVLDVRVNIYSMAFIVVLISTDKVFWVFFRPHRDAPLSANNTQWQQRKQRILHIPGLLLLDQLQNRVRDRERKPVRNKVILSTLRQNYSTEAAYCTSESNCSTSYTTAVHCILPVSDASVLQRQSDSKQLILGGEALIWSSKVRERETERKGKILIGEIFIYILHFFLWMFLYIFCILYSKYKKVIAQKSKS